MTTYESAFYQSSDRAYDYSNIDIVGRMYPAFEEIEEYMSREPDKPLLLVEYCHSMGNGPGDFEDYFERIQKYDALCGGFVWEWCDHAIYKGKAENGKSIYYYGGDHGEEIHDGNFCMDGLVYPDRTPHTGLKEYKNVSRPARVVSYDQNSGEIVLHNYLNYVDLKDYLYQNYYPVFQDMTLIGVTGTNGKTTIGYMIYQALTLLGHPCAYMGTIGFYYCGKYLPMVNTTPDVDILYDYFLKAKEAGCQTLVMEVSSHALAKDRIHGLEFDEVAFTNLTQDHLDYHKTLENYAAAKQLLFKKTRRHKIAVINGDDPHGDYFCLEDNHNITISDKKGDLVVSDIEFSHLGTSFAFSYKEKQYHTHIQMVGRYNVYNYLTPELSDDKHKTF